MYYDEQTEGKYFNDLVRRVGLLWLMRFMQYQRAGNPVYTSNGPGACASQYEPWMLEHLLVSPGPYVPCFLDPLTLTGKTTIRQHLTGVHGQPSRRVERLRDDNAYRLHDMLHEEA